jgi:putative addiction module component (TIGR02574 family)
MPQSIDVEAVRKLSAAERLKLIDAIWDSFFTEDLAEAPLSKQQKEQIRRRDAELDANPESAVSLAEMRAKLKAVKFKGQE